MFPAASVILAAVNQAKTPHDAISCFLSQYWQNLNGSVSARKGRFLKTICECQIVCQYLLAHSHLSQLDSSLCEQQEAAAQAPHGSTGPNAHFEARNLPVGASCCANL